MVSCSADQSGQFLSISCCRQVTAKCVEDCRRQVRDQMKHLRPGFALLCDLTHIESMDTDCAQTLGALIELCSSREMGVAVWVIPGPSKGIGGNLFSRFQPWHPGRVLTRPDLAEPVRCLMPERPALADPPAV